MSRSLAGVSVGDLAAGVGLLLVAIVSVALLSGQVPLVPGDGGDDGGGGAVRTPTPSNVVIVDPRADVVGTILYVKAGNIWLQHGAKATALTSGGHDSMASFSPDGEWIYFVRTIQEPGRWRISGVARRFQLATPSLMRVRTDGTGEPEQLLVGRILSGSYTWSYFLRQPVVSANGTVVVITDGPDPSKSDVVLKVYDPTTGSLTALKAPQNAPLGHQDPAWSPDGSSLLYVKNASDGSKGAPVIMRFDVASGKAVAVTGPGYSSPAWSPDGQRISATRVTSFGTDVVILEARTGKELLRVTDDERSFGAVWSPAGDAIAYLAIDGGVTDLWLARLAGGQAPALDGDPLQLTIAAGLDPASRPGWWIPEAFLPTPAPTAVPSAIPSAPAGSSGPSSPTGSPAPSGGAS
ncbi:MAG: hypothetical protein ABI598_06390 [Chloroflexota bacterium]